jgi:hypothetical protein
MPSKMPKDLQDQIKGIPEDDKNVSAVTCTEELSLIYGFLSRFFSARNDLGLVRG